MGIIEIKNGITLREVTIADARGIYETIDSHRDYLKEWLPFVAHLKSVKEEEDFLSSILSKSHNSQDAVYIIEDGEFTCGLIGFHFSDAQNHRTEIGYWLLPEYQHYGIMTECVRYICRYAIENKEMNRIQIRCAVDNTSSNAIPKRLGFYWEGTEREGELLTSGEYTDIHVYSILKREIEQW